MGLTLVLEDRWKKPRGDEDAGVGLFVQSGHGGQSKELCFSPDGSLLISAGRGTICIFDVARARQLAEIVVGEHQSTPLACSPCGSRLAASCGHRGLIWDLSDLKQIGELHSEQGALLGAAGPLFGAPARSQLCGPEMVGDLGQSRLGDL